MGTRHNGDDPIIRNVEKGDHFEDLSPMDPPDAYSPPGAGQSVPYEEMHPVLRELRDEHTSYLGELDAFEQVLPQLTDRGPDLAANKALGRFFRILETEVLPHNRREERELFPLLAERLIESGEHSKGPQPTTGVDILETDHVSLLQQSAVVLNLLRLVERLPDPASQQVVLQAAAEQGKTLAADLRLHIFREDEVILSLAHKLITTAEFDRMGRKVG